MASDPDRRSKSLCRNEVLNTSLGESFDSITELAAAVCGAPFAAVSFLNDDQQCSNSTVVIKTAVARIAESFCRYTLDTDDLFVVNDALNDPRFTHNQADVLDPKVRFYAGRAIRASGGTAIGAICVLDTETRPDGLTLIERSMLKVLARQIEDQLELRASMKERERQLSASRHLAEQLAFQGSHDALTEIPNRGHFVSLLHAQLAECDRNGTSLTLALVDIDDFKQTNDGLGHDAGDALLRGLAANLKSFPRSAGSVARLGGDEFSLILTDATPEGPDPTVREELLRQIRLPITYRTQTLECRASVGISTYPKDAGTADELIKCSDLALAAAKLKRNSAVVFEKRLLASFEARLRAVGKVRACLASDAFDPFYQPKVDLVSGRCTGFEALLRWRDPESARLPSIFDIEFPDKPLVAQIGVRMIEKILDDMHRWAVSGVAVGKIAINSSAVDFARDDFAENLLAQLRTRGISPKSIEIEITECVFLGRGVSHIVRALRLLRAAGVTIALDDFGTGYASLTHLRQFPIDVLKIDQTFVGGITQNPDDAAIVRAVIGLSKNLGFISVAEGIESVAQEAFVRHHGCDLGQGYLYGAAVPACKVDYTFGQFTQAA